MDANTQFMKVYDEFADAIFRHCYFRIFDRERAKELTQETFTKTLEYAARGGKFSNARAFLYKVANNLIIDESRRKKPVSLDKMREENGFDVMSANADSRIIANTEAAGILKIIEKLDPKYRDVVLMKYIDDLTPKEISEITGESENNISVRLHRGLKQIKEIFNE